MERADQQMEDERKEDHPAMISLQNLLDTSQISQDVFSSLKFKFEKLHQAFSQSCSSEQVLLRKTRDLNKELKAQKLTIQNSAEQQQDHRTTLTALRQYVTNIQVELDATQEQIASTETNTTIKKKEKEKLAAKVARAKDDQIAQIEPQKKQLQNEISALDVAIKEKKAKIEQLKLQSAEMTDKIKKFDEEISDLDKKKRSSNQRMLEIGSIPIKTRQKCSSVEATHGTMLSEEKSALNQLESTQSNLQQLIDRFHDYEDKFKQVTEDIEVTNQGTVDARDHLSDLQKQIAEQNNIKQQRDYESKKEQKHVMEADKEISNLDQKIDNIMKDIQKKEKESFRMEEIMSKLAIEKKTLEGQLHIMNLEKERETQNNAKLRKQYEKESKGRETALRELAKLEGMNEKEQIELNEAYANRNKKQEILDSLIFKERENTQLLLDASLVRDRKAREMASMKKRTGDAKTMAIEKNLDFLDLCHKLEHYQQQMREFSELYEKVKLDRNRHVNTIQTSRQLIVETKEKIKILENEVEVLRGEYEAVTSAVKKQKNILSEAFKRRDSTKRDLKAAENEYKALQTQIDFQANETDRLNHALQSVEEQINGQQHRYAIQADDCASRQRMLIDKQDELCIIHEQLNRHEEVMRKGEIQLRRQDEQIKLLNLQLRDFMRRIDVYQRKIPQLVSYEEEIDELVSQLNRERNEVDNITKRLEVPDLKERKRAYCGKDFTMKELEDKVSLYEQRINSKEQQLWEKQILLREIEDKIKAISEEATRDVSKVQKIFEKGGKMRSEAMAHRRKKLAALSEMAIYKAQQVELEEVKEATKKELDEAQQRTARGEDFDEFAGRMIRMKARDIEKARNPEMYQDDEDDFDNKIPGRQKFDAYPTADGLSRPYGAFPVFQPAPSPGYIRHYHNEQDRDIEI